MEEDEEEDEKTAALKGKNNDCLSDAGKDSHSSLEAYSSLMQMRDEDATQEEVTWTLSQSGRYLREREGRDYVDLTTSFTGDDNGI